MISGKECNYIFPDGKRCNKFPSFNYPGQKTPIRCSKHHEEEMIDVKHGKCEIKGCSTQSYFNYPNKTNGARCKTHIKNGMVDVISKKCAFPGCTISPTFNYEGEKRLYCREHSSEEMIDVSSKKCDSINCKNKARFGLVNEVAIKRKDHKSEDMIDMKHKLCEYKNCFTSAKFNDPNEKTGRFCGSHKYPDMINVCDKKCEKCSSNAVCGCLFAPKKHCFKHRSMNEYKNNKPICHDSKCKEYAFYTDDETNYPKRCETHKLENDINIIEKSCSNCKLLCFLNDKTRLCNDCNNFIVKKIHKAKENEVIDYLKIRNVIFESCDKIPQDSCSKYRPDAVINFIYFKIILEIDEHQHRNYEDKCEMVRMLQLQQDYGGIPIIFIRYNPDNYKDANKDLIKPNQKRLKILYDNLRSFKNLQKDYENNKVNLSPLNVMYLFYDGFDGKSKLEPIDILKKVKELNDSS